MSHFRMVTDLPPRGDQPKAIAQLVEGIQRGYRYQTLLGVTGSGKSVVASTPVLLKQGPSAWVESIGSFVDRLLSLCRAEVARRGDTEVLDLGGREPVEAYSFDPRTGETGWRPVRQVLRHRPPDTLWAVETACGRSVTVTGDHNLYVLRDGRLRLLRTDEVRPGDLLPLPRGLPEPPPSPEGAPSALSLPRAGDRTPDGRGGRGAVATLARPRTAAAGDLEGLRAWPALATAELRRLLRACLERLGSTSAAGVILSVPSRDAASDLAWALLRFGVVAALEPGPQWRVRISGAAALRALRDAVGVDVPLPGDARTHEDPVPLPGWRLRQLRTALRLPRAAVASHLGCGTAALERLEEGESPLPRGLAERWVALLRDEARTRGDPEAGAQGEEMALVLRLGWTPVLRLERVPPQGPVYDLAVMGTETFLAGWGGLFVHNTYTMARVIEQVQRPTLVLAHNKTLAAQLYSEFRQFFPENAVRYFVSYYDYYQPEAYVPQTDLYIAKDASINDEIDRLRHASTKALMERRDVIVVASVSCIYGLGSPQDYQDVMLFLRRGEQRSREEILRRLVDVQYERNDIDFARGRFRVRGDVIEVFPAYEDRAVRIELFGDEVERLLEIDPLTGEVLAEKPAVAIWPAKHWVTTAARLDAAIRSIEEELRERVQWFKDQGKLLEAQRLEFRTKYDLEMLREVGYCPGIENYSRHLSGRAPGERPGCLLDYFPRDFLVFIDESHVTVPQLRGMVEGDRARKKNLVDFGFRLPSAYDNRPLTFEEFESLVPQVVFVSATPGPYELQVSSQVVEQIVRPTGLVDPYVEVRPAKGQVDDLMAEIKAQVEKKERTLVTTLTKRMAEDLAEYLQEMGVKVHYLHSEVDTLQRVQILKDLRQGTYDVLVGINLLREGLDLPEVSLVAILDADREGYLRSETSLIQTMGRAARNVAGRVILYADEVTESMRRAIDETNRRREIQLRYNEEHGITPTTIAKPIRDLIELEAVAEEDGASGAVRTSGAEVKEGAVLTAHELIGLAEHQRAVVPWDIARLLMLNPAELEATVEALEREMRKAAAELQFEKAAVLRDQIRELRKGMGEPYFAPAGARGKGRRHGGPGRSGGRRRSPGPGRPGSP
jgi:excinuclease ABC subunit B